jgi:hypothetical protein
MLEDGQIETTQDSYTFTNDIAVINIYGSPVVMKLVVKTTVYLNKLCDSPPSETRTVFELTSKHIVRTFEADEFDQAIAEYNRLVLDQAGYNQATKAKRRYDG